MRKLFMLLCILAMVPAASFSQTWEEVSDDGKLLIEKTLEECTNEKGTVYEYVFLKFTNNTSEDIDLTFQLPVWLNGHINANLSDGETHKSLHIPANGSVTGDCDAKLGTLKIYSRLMSMEGGSVLTDFEIRDLNIK